MASNWKSQSPKPKHLIADVRGHGVGELVCELVDRACDQLDPSHILLLGPRLECEVFIDSVKRELDPFTADQLLRRLWMLDPLKAKDSQGKPVCASLASEEDAEKIAELINLGKNENRERFRTRTVVSLGDSERHLEYFLGLLYRGISFYSYNELMADGRDGVFPRASASSLPPLVVSTSRELKAKEFRIREPLLVTKNGHPVFHTASTNEVHAWRGTGKTGFGIGLANALATGSPFLAWKAARKFRVLYIEGELPGHELQERFSKMADECDELMVVTPEEQPDSHIPLFSSIEGRELIEASVVANKVEVLFLDSVSSLANISTNDEEAWLEISAWLKVMRNRHGVAIFYMHHDGKGGAQRGHSKHEDLLDKAVHLSWKDGTSSTQGIGGLSCTLKFDKARQPVKEDSFLDIALVEEDGRLVWMWSAAETKSASKGTNSRVEKIKERLKAGKKMKEIAEELCVDVRTLQRDMKKHIKNAPLFEDAEEQEGGY